MAAELGIVLDDQRGAEAVSADTPALSTLLDTLDAERDSVLVFFEPPDLFPNTRPYTTKGFTIVKTGSADPFHIGIHNKTLADDLVNKVKEDASGTAGIVLDFTFDSIKNEDHAIIKRSSIYRSALASGSLRYEALPLHGYVYDEGIGKQAVDKLTERLQKPDAEPVVAILTRTEFTTIATVDYIRERPPESLPIACYSESIVFGVLKRLCGRDSPLRAACGVDFYYYGRYAVRVASMRREMTTNLGKFHQCLSLAKRLVTGMSSHLIGFRTISKGRMCSYLIQNLRRNY
ncbi:hypothetical protein [Singulisphaera sp. PoT]|uniref:hypothetical protein n=1 Tax=Singulisphaera sp. PoT TaxID=3411797 RepID=UPI003BF49328